MAVDPHCAPPGGGPHVADDYCESEGSDPGRLELPDGQQEMVRRLRAAMDPAAPLVGLLVHGGSFAFGAGVLEALDAVVDAWQPGIGGAAAIARALFGDVSPAGRTPQTWYATDTELPAAGTMSLYPSSSAASSAASASASSSASSSSASPPSPPSPPPPSKGLTYRHYTGAPTFAFGHGLSYTTFAYSALTTNASSLTTTASSLTTNASSSAAATASSAPSPAPSSASSSAAATTARVPACATVGVEVAVANTGGVASDEVVQLYVETPDATVPAPRLRLAAFARVHVAAGATTTVRLAVGAAARAVMSAKGAAATGDAIYTEAADEQVIEPGRLVIHVGGGQPGFGAATLNTTVAIEGGARLVDCEAR